MPLDPGTMPIAALCRNQTRLLDWSRRERARTFRWRIMLARLQCWRPWPWGEV